MSLKIGRDVFWLCTKSGDIIFRRLEDAVKHVSDALTEMSATGETDTEFFGDLFKLERRGEDFKLSQHTNAMWREITILMWNEQAMAKKELDKVRMGVVRQYDKHGGIRRKT